ncbi:Monoglyceride lipase, putative [Perkinsus marinus ATCC 50983]|uniref:Monoglyceride lipase, putative n=1 Tax=Perkinsus marinus (strain ATCC 50983 / TXsc) TaxID=423536 RepID=C5LZ71_PERM5|nr:Monoglyceride lipase, putative [Perkinsus marinus ATCC 50983]EEQ97971.1 Monoglyceride lipase, putative [Perkinsus marinus ATCC 50983]|eukprot:XP_002765254.1 Monoglyceride lipase, putative [Perkinsus marinus ATCC 50983]
MSNFITLSPDTTWFLAIVALMGVAVLMEKFLYDTFYKKIANYKTGEMRRKIVPAEFNTHPHALQGILPEISPASPFKGDAGLFPLKSTGDKIFWETFVPTDVEHPRGVIVFCHGYADHSGFHMFNDARMFCEREKYACVLFDQVGSGRSDGLQAYIDDWFKYCQLAKEFIDQFVLATFVPSLAERSCHLPFYGYGHSMGGGLVTSLAILHPELFDGIILQSPMLKIPQGMHPSWVVEQLLRVVARIAPKAPIVPTKNLGEVMYHHRDSIHYAAKFNRLVYRGKPRLSTALCLLQGQDFVSANFKSVKTPFIVCHGAADEITDPHADVEM